MAKTRKGGTGKTPASGSTGPRKAVDKPVGQPEKAREEAPIGWVFGTEGPSAILGDANAHGPGSASVDGDQLGASPTPDSNASAVSPGSTTEAPPGPGGHAAGYSDEAAGAPTARLHSSGTLGTTAPAPDVRPSGVPLGGAGAGRASCPWREQRRRGRWWRQGQGKHPSRGRRRPGFSRKRRHDRRRHAGGRDTREGWRYIRWHRLGRSRDGWHRHAVDG